MIKIREMKDDDESDVLGFMKEFYSSPAVSTNGSEEIFKRDIAAFTQNLYALRLYESLGYKTVGYANWRKGRFNLMEKSLK